LDVGTYRKLKESKNKNPKLTTLVSDPDLVLAMYLESLSLPIDDLGIIWSQKMLSQIMENFREIIFHVEKISKEKGIKFRVIVDAKEENTWFLKSMNYCNIRQLENITENFQLTDNKVCVEPLFEKGQEQFSQILWSNATPLVNHKQSQFEKLWRIAKPYS
jgi:hypothetical protein